MRLYAVYTAAEIALGRSDRDNELIYKCFLELGKTESF